MAEAGLTANELMIRLMNEQDVEFIAALEKRHFSTPWSERELLLALNDPLKLFLVAYVNGTAAGYVGCTISFEDADIVSVCVDESCRGQGIATALLNKMTAILLEKGVQRMFLEVRVSNEPARSLYTKMGFYELNYRRNYYQNPIEDALVMLKEISNEDIGN